MAWRRTTHMMNRLRLFLPSTALTALALAFGCANADGTQISLGAASKYTVFSMASTFQNNSNVAITGDVAVGPHGSVSVASPSSISGTLYRDSTATYSGGGSISGGVQVTNLNQAVNDAINASNAFASLTPTSTLTSITKGTSLVGNGADNVIKLTGDIKLGGSNNLTLTGGANDFFIFNIFGGLDLSGSASIVLAGGLTADHVVFNFLGTGTELTTKVGNTLRGTILAVNRSATFHGAFGQIIVGGSNLTLMSGAQVNGMPFQPTSVPEGGPGILLIAVTCFGLLAIRQRVFAA